MIFRTNLLLLVICLFGALGYSIAQNATIKGNVVDQQNQIPLIAATVQAGESGTITNIEGSFDLELSPGTYQLKVNYIGYESYVEEINLVAGQIYESVFQLSPSSVLLDAATVTSGKYEQSLGELTVSLDILEPRLIQNTGKTSLDGAIQKIPGVTVIDGQANIRGGSGFSLGAGSRVLLLVDDIPILEGASGSSNWNDIPIENTAQVEVVKGATSALYGSSALNGIINVRTSYATSKPRTTGAVYYTGMFDPPVASFKWWDDAPGTYGASLTHSRKIGKLDLVLGGFYYKENSYNQDFSREYGRLNFGTQYRINDRLTIGLNGNFNKGENQTFFYWASDTTAYTGAPNTDSNNQLTRMNLDPRITYYDKKDNRHRFLGRMNLVDNKLDNDRANRADQFYGEYQFQRRFKDHDLVLTTGIVGQHTSSEAQLYGDTTFTSNNIAAYLQLDKKFFDRLNVTFGFRYEYNELDNPGFVSSCQEVAPSTEKESKPVFRLGLNYAFSPVTFVRASIGQGYRYPTIAEKYIDTQVGGVNVIPNPELESETGWSSEIGIKQGFQLGGFNGFLDASAFLMKYQDMMEFNLLSTACLLGFQSTNIGDTEIKGFETSITGKGDFGPISTTLLAGYTFVDPRFKSFDNTPIPANEEATVGQINANNSSSSDNILKYRSKHIFKLDLEGSYKKFSLGLATLYNSRFEAIDVAFALIIPGIVDFREKQDEGSFLVNIRSAYQITEAIKGSLILSNAFNDLYAIRPGLMGAPRNLTARIDFDF